MGRLSKSFALLLVLLMALSSLSLLIIKPACAQSIPQPSVPEFMLKLVQDSFNVPIPYSIEVTIKNQPFIYSFGGITYNLYYNLRFKDHSGQVWTDLYQPGKIEDGHYINTTDYPPQSNSEYTILSFDLSGAQLDFQVEALVGHNSSVFVPDHPLAPWIGGQYEPAIAYDKSSSWSNTQTITEHASSTSSSSQTSEPTSTPIVPEFSTLMILQFFAVVILISIMFFGKRKSKK